MRIWSGARDWMISPLLSSVFVMYTNHQKNATKTGYFLQRLLRFVIIKSTCRGNERDVYDLEKGFDGCMRKLRVDSEGFRT